ncbi:MAG: DUF3187 family protein [Thermoanaerobaculia bacterium]|nr:DUF3187 family protein [Thermoanaerobaculia bacterium]
MRAPRSLGRMISVLGLLAAVLPIWPSATVSAAEESGTETDRVDTEYAGIPLIDTGPVRVREQFLLDMGFLAFDPATAEILDPGQWQIDFVQSGTNSWSQSDAVDEVLTSRDERAPLTLARLRAIEGGGGKGLFYVDGELYRTSLSVRRGLTDRWQVAVTVPLLDFGGGFADGLVQETHDALGIPQAGRLGVPKDDYTVYLRDSGGNELFRTVPPDPALGDVTLTLKRQLHRGDSLDVAIEGHAKLPTGDESALYSSGATDWGILLAASRYFDRSCIHLAGGGVWAEASDLYHTEDQLLFMGFAAWERALGEKSTVFVQGTVAESPFQGLELDRLEDLSYLLDFGFKRSLGPETVAFVALSENLVNFGSSADVGLHLGVTHLF